MTIYLNELAPWERKQQFLDQEVIKSELQKQTGLMQEQIEAATRNYPIIDAPEVPYDRFLDGLSEGFDGMEDAMCDINDGLQEISSELRQTSEGIGHLTDVTKSGFAGLAIVQTISTIAINQTIKESTADFIESFEEGVDSIIDAVDHSANMVTNAIDRSASNITQAVNQSANRVTNAIDRNTDTISKILNKTSNLISRKIDQGTHKVATTLNYGFKQTSKELIRNQEVLRSGFENLSYVLKNRRKTQALEDFQDAMQFYAKGCKFSHNEQWFVDSLKYYKRSIVHYPDNHVAHLRIANICHFKKTCRNLDDALKHYHLCYVYAEGHNKYKLAANACLQAGWLSAVHASNIDQAITYTQKSLSLDPSLGSAHYNLAKFYSLKQDAKNSLLHLNEAMEKFDRNYYLNAMFDPDFKPIKNELTDFLYSLHEEAKKNCLKYFFMAENFCNQATIHTSTYINHQISWLAKKYARIIHHDELKPLRKIDSRNCDEFARIKEKICTQMKMVSEKDSYFGYLDWESEMESIFNPMWGKIIFDSETTGQDLEIWLPTYESAWTESKRIQKKCIEIKMSTRNARRQAAAKLKADCLKAKLLEKKRLQAERQVAAKLEAERLEAQRIEAERIAAEEAERQRLEKEKLEAERQEKARLAAEEAERQRLKLEAESIEKEKRLAVLRDQKKLAEEQREVELRETKRIKRFKSINKALLISALLFVLFVIIWHFILK